eukprot:TRINITY_DN8368_c0_g1_i1.p1 TRINITY_DN8368_c0_g1~~TRINITY_DN8368_c0_g1_i1.p1  ORF type:complete len:107 (+),score=2.39 TRINITY_DN8368_c0_g1_i1:53-373(+)
MGDSSGTQPHYSGNYWWQGATGLHELVATVEVGNVTLRGIGYYRIKPEIEAIMRRRLEEVYGIVMSIIIIHPFQGQRIIALIRSIVNKTLVSSLEDLQESAKPLSA